MSWMQQLYETYEQCARNPDFQTGEHSLLPIYHSSQQAHIEVVLNEHAELVGAKVIEKEETIIPVTEDSAGRAGLKDAPHALADKIQYCAGDYYDFGGQKTPHFGSYIEQLEKWCVSSNGHEKVKIIFDYLKKKRLVQDLIAKGILHVDSGNYLLNDWDTEKLGPEIPAIFRQLNRDQKTKKYDQGSALVRWRVQIPIDTQDATWKDESIIDSWRSYCLRKDSKTNICQITGKDVPLASNHPRRIRSGADGAKLISIPTDKSYFTYQGRFAHASEACSISVEATQKAHNALSWLIRRQGFQNGNQAIVSWAVTGKDVPKITDNSLDFLGDTLTSDDEYYTGDAGQRFALKLNNKIKGYTQSLGSTEKIVVISLDSPPNNKGRISILIYRELTKSDFLNRIEAWHTQCAWPQNFGKDKRFIGAPSPRDIAWAAFGSKIEGKKNQNFLSASIERLLPCIVDGMPIPRDLVESSVRRASNRVGFENKYWEWEKCLGITCGLYKAFQKDRNYQMTLENKRKNRDYLYGRLLAIAENIEWIALSVAGEERSTTAARFMQRFADRPFSTWRSIELALTPYMARLRSKRPAFLRKMETLIDSVMSDFQQLDELKEGFTNDSPLTGEFLLGYHCQRRNLRAKNSRGSDDESDKLEH